MADFAVRLYLRFCQLAPPGPAATPPRGPDPRELLRFQGVEWPGPTLTAVQFLGLSPESFVREVVLPGAGTGPDDREGEAARLLDLVVRGSILGTDVPALQAGLAINPAAVARAFAPPDRVNSADLPPHRFVVESDSYCHRIPRTPGGREGDLPPRRLPWPLLFPPSHRLSGRGRGSRPRVARAPRRAWRAPSNPKARGRVGRGGVRGPADAAARAR